MSTLLTSSNLAKTFAAHRLFERVCMGIAEGERLGMIGPNGSGKSTLLKILAGIYQPDEGEIIYRKNLRMGYVAQTDVFPAEQTVQQIVENAIDQIHDEHDRAIHATRTLERIGFTKLEQTFGELSGGWRKRLAIACQLAREVDLLLMDEPTNHLDVEGILWLEEMLEDAPFALIVVTHDRCFLEDVCTRVLELSTAYPEGTFTVQGPYSEFLRRKAEFLEAQQQQQVALASKVRRDIEWLSRGAKARRTKAKGRIEASHDRMAELAELQRRNTPQKAAEIDFAATGRKTKNIVVAKGIAKSLGGRELFRGLDLTLSPGMRLGLIGSNGSGKTTLIRLLSGKLEPDAGSITRAEGLRVVTFTQQREELDRKQSLRDALSPIGDTVHYNGRSLHVVSWAERFLFRRDQFNTAVGDLSGGEQARILIARLMLQPADLLILDEPTNDLDIPSLEVLEESLEEFPRAVVLVTHDRFMLERLATDVLGLDGRGNARSFASYHQWQRWWEEEQENREPEQAAKPAKPQAEATPVVAAAAAPAKKKLSYKEQRELETMEANILAAEERVKELEAKTHDPAVASDHRKLTELYTQLGEATAKVSQLYNRWAELEAKQG
jgi:ATP-binding cassette subfamily F protein uup